MPKDGICWYCNKETIIDNCCDEESPHGEVCLDCTMKLHPLGSYGTIHIFDLSTVSAIGTIYNEKKEER